MTEDDILWLYAPEERADWRRVDALIEKRGEEAIAEILHMAAKARRELDLPPTPEKIEAQIKLNRLMFAWRNIWLNPHPKAEDFDERI